MKMIDNTSLMNQFCLYFNSQLCVIDFIYKVNDMKNKCYRPNQKSNVVLPIYKKEIYSTLKKISYIVLLEKLFENLKINENCLDIFRSEMDDNLLKSFILAIEAQKKEINFLFNDDKELFIVEMPDFISDLCLAPLSIFHTEVVETCSSFLEHIKAIGDSGASLFLNPLGATPYTHFIQMWIAYELGINIENPLPYNIIVV